MTFAQHDVHCIISSYTDWLTHSWSRSRYTCTYVELTKVLDCDSLDVFVLKYS